jgi:hypothetical protein
MIVRTSPGVTAILLTYARAPPPPEPVPVPVDPAPPPTHKPQMLVIPVGTVNENVPGVKYVTSYGVT